MTDRNLDDLHPLLEPLCKEFLRYCEEDGLKVIITETWRDPVREDTLHAEGITKETGRTCKHCFMLNGTAASKAYDYAVLDETGQMVKDGTDARYTHCGKLIKQIGMIWGGDFHHPDYDHVEIA